MDAEGQRLRRIDARPIGGQRLQRVQVRRARVRVLRRHRTATDVPLRHDDRLSKAHAKSEPFVLLVLAQAVDAEVHAEAAPIDFVHAKDPCHRAEGACSEERCRAAAQAIRSRPASPDQPKAPAGEVRDCLAPRPAYDAHVNGVTPEPGNEGAVEADALRDRRAVGKRERQRIRVAVVLRDDLLEDAEALAVDEAVVLVDEEELPITRDSGLRQFAPVELLDREALDRAVRDPGDTRAQASKPT